mmetsp:Transcript_5242/g.3684  ORF Transcript_5242/g.3684 Transcript_5242/m.3684 type:complete len:111 (-) Transcript_5242:107-439(-)|eukprot:CAMPEP_0116881152 /NCGR_PEP_ID=MMETSP0463-20121206/13250_1 /TAXON_ID=181622 /ORGANISM="Strombidinopsis sp, Strain SopsisLIS2011" /LENGTH=110 /DNA_ID=CAMNT_0004532783 /DNA_START=622 /DNA_END=954 /DNA_ORIENTATION=-
MSAIVITSSAAGVRPIGGFIPYSCSKVFASYLGRALHWELKGKVDVLAWESGEVSTNLTYNKPADVMSVTTPRLACLAMMRELGNESHSAGHIKHKISISNMMMFPDFML